MNDRRFLTFRNLFSRRPHVLKIVPELLAKFSLNEAVFLNVLDYWITKEYFRNGNTFWACSSNRLLENFMPFFSRPTLWRIIKDLRAKGVLPQIDPANNGRAIAWTLNYDRIIEILGANDSEDKPFQNETSLETTTNTAQNFHSNISDDKAFQNETGLPTTKKPDGQFLEPRDNSMSKEKKDNSNSIDRSYILVELFSPRDSFKNETGFVQNETGSFQNETGSFQNKTKNPEFGIPDWEMDFLDSHSMVRLPVLSKKTGEE